LARSGVRSTSAGVWGRRKSPTAMAARLTDSGDDAADALRYLVATKSRAVTQRKLREL